MANYYHEARAHTKKLKQLQEEGAKRRDRRLDAKAEAGVVRSRGCARIIHVHTPRSHHQGTCWI